MKRTCFLLLAATIIIISCTKTKTTVNNGLTQAGNTPAFSVNGISDIKFTNTFGISATLYINVAYLDSAQESVTLSISGLPAGIVLDSSQVTTGIPSFSTTIVFYDTTAAGAVPGNYPITLTATPASGKQKFYHFNMKISPMPTGFLGKYDSCHYYCGAGATYADSVYLDPTIPNKIWFINYANSGQHVYGLISPGGMLMIPSQTIGINTYNGSGILTAEHAINISISGSCALNMR